MTVPTTHYDSNTYSGPIRASYHQGELLPHSVAAKTSQVCRLGNMSSSLAGRSRFVAKLREVSNAILNQTFAQTFADVPQMRSLKEKREKLATVSAKYFSHVPILEDPVL